MMIVLTVFIYFSANVCFSNSLLLPIDQLPVIRGILSKHESSEESWENSDELWENSVLSDRFCRDLLKFFHTFLEVMQDKLDDDVAVITLFQLLALEKVELALKEKEEILAALTKFVKKLKLLLTGKTTFDDMRKLINELSKKSGLKKLKRAINNLLREVPYLKKIFKSVLGELK